MKADAAIVEDILMACGRIEDFLAGFTHEMFREVAVVQSAVIRELEVIGEAAKRLSAEFRDAHPEVAWKKVAGMRDRLIHAYDDIDLDAVWRVATEEVPTLRVSLTRLRDGGQVA
jgi:uncharacterized protein with HEPN domain